MDWESIKKAWELVNEGAVSRVDGTNWKVYRVGVSIRIDTESQS